MKKKGFMGDFAFYFIYLFIMAIFIVVIYFGVSKFNDAWQTSTNVTESKTMVSNAKAKFLTTWNWLLIMLLLGIFIAIVVLAFSLKSHPAFAMIAFLVLIILGGVSVYLSNAFNSFATDSTIQATANEFTLIPFVMNNLPYFVIGLGIIFIIVLYAKNTGGGVI